MRFAWQGSGVVSVSRHNPKAQILRSSESQNEELGANASTSRTRATSLSTMPPALEPNVVARAESLAPLRRPTRRERMAASCRGKIPTTLTAAMRSRSLARGRLYSSVDPAQSIELAQNKTSDGTLRCASAPRVSIVIPLPEERGSPERLSSDRFSSEPRTGNESRHSRTLAGTSSRREDPSPLSSSLSTRHHPLVRTPLPHCLAGGVARLPPTPTRGTLRERGD